MLPGTTDRDYLSGLMVLLVEDDSDARDALAEFLGRRVGGVLQAANGIEGLALFNEKRPALVVTDVTMPGLDGTTMARYIKECEPTVQILAITASGHTDQRQKGSDTVFDDYLAKPIKADQLEAALLRSARTLRLLNSVPPTGSARPVGHPDPRVP